MGIVSESQTWPHWHHVATQRVCISCFLRFIFKKHVTAIWKAESNYETKHSNYIYQGLFPIKMQYTLPKASVYPRASIDMTHSHRTTPHGAVTQPSLVMGPCVWLWFQKPPSLQTPWVQCPGWGGKAKAWVLLHSGSLTPCRQQNWQRIVKDHFKEHSELCYPQNRQQCAHGQGRFLWVLIIVDKFPFFIPNFQHGSFINLATLLQHQTHLTIFWCV